MGKHLDPGLIRKKCYDCYWCGSIPVCWRNLSYAEHPENAGWKVACPVCSSSGPIKTFIWDAIDAWNSARKHVGGDHVGEVTFTVATEGNMESSSGTEKQKKYAISISQQLDINLPTDLSKENLRSWIGLFDPVVNRKINHFDALENLMTRINVGSKEAFDAASEMMERLDSSNGDYRISNRFCMAPASLVHMTAEELRLVGRDFEVPDEAFVFLTGNYLGRPRGVKLQLESSERVATRWKMLFRSVDEFMEDMTTNAMILNTYGTHVPCDIIRDTTVEELSMFWRMKHG